jgi:alpha-amylase
VRGRNPPLERTPLRHGLPSASPTHTAATSQTVTFTAVVTTWYGQNVFLVGSIPALGKWDPTRAVPLSAANYPTWSVTVTLPANTYFEYKFIKKDPDGTVTWESGANRSYTTGTGAATVNATWK